MTSTARNYTPVLHLGKIGPFSSASLLFLTEKEEEEESVTEGADGRLGLPTVERSGEMDFLPGKEQDSVSFSVAPLSSRHSIAQFKIEEGKMRFLFLRIFKASSNFQP